jgi:hypothetical protein
MEVSAHFLDGQIEDVTIEMRILQWKENLL